MRGKRYFRKIIKMMPSGRHAWNILDQMDNRVDGGLAKSYRDARKQAREAERRAVNLLPPVEHKQPSTIIRRGRTCLGRFMPLPNESNPHP